MVVPPAVWAALRTQYGPTDREVGAALGLSANHVYRVRTGSRRPGTLFFEGVRRALPEVSLDDFCPRETAREGAA